MVVTIWSHLWVVSGPARRLLMAEWCPGRLQGLTKGWDGQCWNMGWVVFLVKDSSAKGCSAHVLLCVFRVVPLVGLCLLSEVPPVLGCTSCRRFRPFCVVLGTVVLPHDKMGWFDAASGGLPLVSGLPAVF